MTLGMKISYAGYFRLHTTNEKGEVTKDTGWFHNLITNSGLDFIGNCPNSGMAFGQRDFTACVAVGTGNTAPAFTDTTLVSIVATTTNSGGPASGIYVAGSPPYWSMVRSWQFPAGTATGNIAELGVGPSQGISNPILFSRALVVDGGGSPTVIPVLSTEALTVTYELRQYINITDNTYSFNLSGVTYSGTYRRSVITSATQISRAFSFDINGQYAPISVYNGTIGTVTGSPSGSQANSPSNGTVGTYTPGTYSMSFQNTGFDINHGNLSGGITAFTVFSESGGTWQFSVSPAIPKTSSYALVMNWNISWARY